MIALGLVASAYGELTGEARILKEKRDMKIAEINRIYLAELGKIKLKELQNGNTEAAEAIEAEIGGKTGESGAIPTDEKEVLRSLIGKWRRTGSGTAIDGHIIEFTDEKSGTFEGKATFKTRYIQRKNMVTIDGGAWVNEITLTADPDVLNGKTENGLTYRLVRLQ